MRPAGTSTRRFIAKAVQQRSEPVRATVRLLRGLLKKLPLPPPTDPDGASRRPPAEG